MSILLTGVEMPEKKGLWVVIHPDGTVEYNTGDEGWKTLKRSAAHVQPPAEEKATVWNQAKEPPKKAGEYLVTGKWRDQPREYWICTFSIFGPICGWENSASNPPVEAWAQITPFEA